MASRLKEASEGCEQILSPWPGSCSPSPQEPREVGAIANAQEQ